MKNKSVLLCIITVLMLSLYTMNYSIQALTKEVKIIPKEVTSGVVVKETNEDSKQFITTKGTIEIILNGKPYTYTFNNWDTLFIGIVSIIMMVLVLFIRKKIIKK